MSRLLFEDWTDYATVGDILGGGVWNNGAMGACSLDTGVTYNGHQTLKFTGGSSPASLLALLPAGFNRVWIRTIIKFGASLYNGGEPAVGTAPVPFGVVVQNATWEATAGFAKAVSSSGTKYTGYAALDSTGESYSGLGTELLTKANLQAIDFEPWDVLVERIGGGETNNLIRVRGWRDGAKVLDKFFVPTASVEWWSQVTLSFDPNPNAANNDMWLGEVEMWDAERDPDPYGYGFLFCDGFDFSGWQHVHGWELGFGFSIGTDDFDSQVAAKTSFGTAAIRSFPSSFTDRWFGKEFDLGPESEVGLHFHLRGAGYSDDCIVAQILSTYDPITDTAVPHVYLVHRKDDGYIEIRRYDGTLIGTSSIPAAIPIQGTEYLSSGGVPRDFSYDNWRHIYFEVGVHRTAGYVVLLIEGQLAFFAQNIDTDETASGAASGVVLGNTSKTGPADFNLDYDNALVTRGIEYRRCEVEWLLPNANGQVDAGVTLDSYETIPQVNAAYEFWWMVGNAIPQFEPDDDGTVAILHQTGTERGSVKLTLPHDPDCHGLIAGVVPMWDCCNADDDTGAPGTLFKGYLRIGSTRYYAPGLIGPLRHLYDDPSSPTIYRGTNGFQDFRRYAWGRNPATGDSWDAAGLPEIGAEAFDCDLMLTVMGAFALRVIPSNDNMQLGGPSVEKNQAWRETEANHVMANMAWREVLAQFEYRNLAWRPTALGGAGALLPYCSDGPGLLTYFDGFDVDVMNRRFWNPSVDLSGEIWQTGGMLHVDGPKPTTGSGGTGALFWSGLYNPGYFDWTDGYIHVQVYTRAGPSGAGRETGIVLWSTYHSMFLWCRNGLIELGTFTGSAGPVWWTIIASVPDTATHPWLRLRHSSEDGRIYGEHSNDGINWSIVGWVTDDDTDEAKFTNFFLGVLHGGSGGGSGAQTQEAIFDNFEFGPVVHW